ncbi:hypothetical protein GHT06_009933 [Daphnia sinensis]|uniref:THAP-type domain-containing protein n=1 Tax=Daphnia sinensis TaxID=1820382 RepID=A0AAD5LGS0_9CRUS|nr:hypothetical protein GHT06_009933 [Daphnia sinensis]
MSQTKPLESVKKKYCVICGLVDGNEKRKTSVFKVGNKCVKWQSIIPGHKTTSKLCVRHFDESDIVKGVTVGHDFYPAERWRLSFSAQPKYHLDVGKSSAWKQNKQHIPLKQLFQNGNKIYSGKKTNVLLTHSLQDCSNSSAAYTSIESIINSASSQDSVQDCFNISANDTSIDSFVNSPSPQATLESIDTGGNMPSVVSPSTVKRSRVKIITSEKQKTSKNGLITKFEDLPLDFVSADTPLLVITEV